ncbi:MAG: NADH-quinone oxidoreductase subunit L [candidate division Zixibacteria bacterium]|nr:NADH-quinone oxidoreductase subunit L [candidate division Zixibacteria bacterium]MBU1471888.1 NADH-quinone oxidoreductase subunit L [candidate division Zixibacteria bacterium]MBU2625584.1 NADH-quinone oxidoreductase subunit L [candidate division Zixibacteria bacterium]
MLNYIWLIPLAPLIGFIINGLIGKRLPRQMVSLIACGSVFISLLVSVIAFTKLLALDPANRAFELSLFSWIPSGSFNVDMAFLLDPLSAVMILVVSGVGFLIHVYSIGYMSHDPEYSRFFTYMNLFTGSMLILVLANNFLLLYVGWEAVGLCSYLLIGFWYKKKSAADAGKKAFIVNRIGDFGFAIGIMLIFWTFSSLNFTDVFQGAADSYRVGSSVMTTITLLLFVGATGKSAQIPLHVWLPDAMEGPTPVSALIHAATMVTAGVYMVARCNVLFVLAPTTLMVVAVVGAVTAFFAATMGLAQNDIKRVLAYSTISQLGYMFLACGVAAFTAGIFHLMTHAFFKALLFLGAGSVIHAMSDEQDMRKMGGLKSKIKVTYWTMLVATLAISGIPGLSGFFSKDEILWKSFSSGHGNVLFWVLGVITAGLTAFYMFRLIFLTFYGKPRYDKRTAEHLHESPKNMLFTLVSLAVLSVAGGWVGIPAALGGGNRFEHFLHPVFARGEQLIHESAHHAHSTEYLLMAISVALVLVSIYFAYLLYLKKPQMATSLQKKFSGLHKLIYNKYYVDEIYSAIVIRPIVNLSLFLWKVVDIVLIDGFVNGLASMVKSFSSTTRTIQTGYLRNYALIFLGGAVIVLAFFISLR